jgi:hypothetical protein
MTSADGPPVIVSMPSHVWCETPPQRVQVEWSLASADVATPSPHILHGETVDTQTVQRPRPPPTCFCRAPKPAFGNSFLHPLHVNTDWGDTEPKKAEKNKKQTKKKGPRIEPVQGKTEGIQDKKRWTCALSQVYVMMSKSSRRLAMY